MFLPEQAILEYYKERGGGGKGGRDPGGNGGMGIPGGGPPGKGGIGGKPGGTILYEIGRNE